MATMLLTSALGSPMSRSWLSSSKASTGRSSTATPTPSLECLVLTTLRWPPFQKRASPVLTNCQAFMLTRRPGVRCGITARQTASKRAFCAPTAPSTTKRTACASGGSTSFVRTPRRLSGSTKTCTSSRRRRPSPRFLSNTNPSRSLSKDSSRGSSRKRTTMLLER